MIEISAGICWKNKDKWRWTTAAQRRSAGVSVSSPITGG